MGRSNSCFRIIACGRDSPETDYKDDLDASEMKSSKDKLGWSFRKKSARHRVLSNIVTSETPAYGSRDISGSSMFSTQPCCDSSQNACLVKCTEEKSPLSLKTSEANPNAKIGNEIDSEFDTEAKEFSVIYIQAGVRRFLARKELLKLKQAATQELPSDLSAKESENVDTILGVSSHVGSEIAEPVPKKESLVTSESEENLITYEGDKIHQLQIANPSAKQDSKRFTHSVESESDALESSNIFDSLPVDLDANVLNEHPKSSEQLGKEAKGSTVHITAQKTFEELSPAAHSVTFMSKNHHIAAEKESDRIFSDVDTTKTLNVAENAGSVCGTELSISSTLDSPEGSEVGATEVHQKPKFPVENKETHENSEKERVHSAKDWKQNLDSAEVESDGSVVSIDVSQIERKLEATKSDVVKEMEIKSGHNQTYESSPQASSGRHIMGVVPQQTLSTNGIAKTKKDKTANRVSDEKPKSLSAVKNSPSNPNHETPFKDNQKNGKRRSSFGSDQERRDSSGSNAIPRFMQATESARAKVQLHYNDSPKSSPDVQDKDGYVKKRHSLPGANGKQGSPRIQQGPKEKMAEVIDPNEDVDEACLRLSSGERLMSIHPLEARIDDVLVRYCLKS